MHSPLLNPALNNYVVFQPRNVGGANVHLHYFDVPPGASLLSFTLYGAGGGGAGGTVSATTANGGGGGGCGAATRGVFPAILLPKRLYIQCGVGGAGGASGGNGSAGLPSHVSTSHLTAAANLVLTAAAGSGATGTSAGSAASVMGTTAAAFSSHGVWTSISGQAGSAGGVGAALVTGVTWGSTGRPTSGGAGGGGATSTPSVGGGGGITITGGVLPDIFGDGQAYGRQSHIFFRPNGRLPFMSTGGPGAGGTAGANGKNGAHGGIGSGGGGGGGCLSGTAGSGGNGGDGFVLIQWV